MGDSNLLFGTAGWSYPDWKGCFYPARKPKGFDELRYLSEYFDCVEVNATFYRYPDAKMTAAWAARVESNPRFLFTFKLHQDLTHGKCDPDDAQKAAAVRAGIAPAADAGRLGALLAQFPWSFRNEPENRARLASLSGYFEGLPVVAELRNSSWDTPAAMKFLADHGLGFCNIDQPASKGSIGPTGHASESMAYFRFHGRNASAWFDRNAGRDEKYDYLYSRGELLEWVDPIRRAASAANRTFVIGNNHFKGQAPANILELKSLITGEKVPVPAPLREAYPQLREVAGTE